MARKPKTPTPEADDEDDLVGKVPAKNSVDPKQELLEYIERYERLDADKRAIASDQKDLMNEMKARGYDTKAVKKIISERKQKPEEVQEFYSIVELYREVLGMN